MPADTILVPEITIDGTLLESLDPDAVLADLRVSRSSGAAATCQLWLDMTDTEGDAIQIGSTIQIEVISLDGVQAGGPIFIGSVTSIGIEVEARRTQLVIGAHDASYTLGQRTVSTSRLTMSPKDVISALASDVGLGADIDDVLGQATLDHVQETGTAHQFITDVARTYGCEWFVEGSTLVVRRRDDPSPITINGTEDLRRFSARFSAIDQATSVSVRRWDPVSKDVATASVDLSSGVALGRTDVPIATRGRNSSTAGAPGTGVANPGPLGGGIDVDVLAQGAVDRHESAMLTGRGEIDVRSDVVPGGRIEIEDVKTEWNGIYYVTAVEHSFGDGKPFTTRFTVGSLEPATMVDLLGSSSASTRDRLAANLAIGIVTDNEDPDGLGRVKVRLPELSDDNESWWARLVQHGAGSGRGWMTIPEIDDEVVVAFEHGDIQHPYVLGGLWNGVDPMPDVDAPVASGAVVSRSFTSRLGHRLEFRDGDGDDAKFVCVTLDNGTTKLYLGNDKIELVSADKAILVETNDASIDLSEQGDITIKAKNIELSADQNITIKGGQNTSVEAGQNVDVKGTNVKVNGTAGANLESSGQAVVKGAMVNIN